MREILHNVINMKDLLLIINRTSVNFISTQFSFTENHHSWRLYRLSITKSKSSSIELTNWHLEREEQHF